MRHISSPSFWPAPSKAGSAILMLDQKLRFAKAKENSRRTSKANVTFSASTRRNEATFSCSLARHGLAIEAARVDSSARTLRPANEVRVNLLRNRPSAVAHIRVMKPSHGFRLARWLPSSHETRKPFSGGEKDHLASYSPREQSTVASLSFAHTPSLRLTKTACHFVNNSVREN